MLKANNYRGKVNISLASDIDSRTFQHLLSKHNLPFHDIDICLLLFYETIDTENVCLVKQDFFLLQIVE